MISSMSSCLRVIRRARERIFVGVRSEELSI